MLSKYLWFSTNIFKYCYRLGFICNKGETGNMVKKVLLLVALVILSFSLIGCQTVQGLGGDIQWTAEETADLLEGE